MDYPTLDLAALDRHEKIALSFSGGKDSLACVYLLARELHRVTIYHRDTGDLLPEVRAVVAHVRAFAPNFVHLQGDVDGWIAEHGMPTDLLPHSAHPVGRAMGEHGAKLVARYDCCYQNLMWPTYRRILADGNTLLIRGTKRVDMQRLPVRTGDMTDGIELLYPIEGWSNDQVFAYLRMAGAPISRVYEHAVNSPECAKCSAWWGEGRDAYLKRYHPRLWLGYRRRLEIVADEIARPLENLRREVAGALDAPALPDDALDAATDAVLAQGVRVLQGNRIGATDAEHVGNLLRFMAPPTGARVLDVGCGFGEVARLMRAARPDLGFVLLNRSARQLAHAPEGDGFKRVLGDMHRIPLPTGSMDGAMFNYTLCHADHVVALAEAARVVEPGGFLFLYDYERLAGDNRRMEQRLAARAYRRDDLLAFCEAAGWQPEAGCAPGGDDTLFRSLFEDDAAYDAIFDELRPVVWKFRREPVSKGHTQCH